MPTVPDIRMQQQAEGIWQFKKSVPVDKDDGKLVNDTITFIYRDGMVTLRLLTLGLGRWKSRDDFYELAARWEGSVLYYRPPFGDWTELAVFEDGRFIDIGNGIKRIFEKIPEKDIVAWNRDIAAPREPHDYRTRPDGGLKE